MIQLWYDFLYAIILGLLTQNLALAVGVGSGNLLKLSQKEYIGKLRYFFCVMLAICFSATLLCYLLDQTVLQFNDAKSPFLRALRPVVYVAVLAVLCIVADFVVSFFFPKVRKSLGDLLASACLNSGALYILLLNRQENGGLFESAVFSITAVAGLALSVMLMRALRERMELVRCPEFMKGAPLALLATALLSLAFMGVANLNFPYL